MGVGVLACAGLSELEVENGFISGCWSIAAPRIVVPSRCVPFA